jgi:hypothetical protein
VTAKEAAEILDLIRDRAPGLRECGVLRVELGGGVAFTLADAEPEAPAAGAAAEPDDDQPMDALHDPWTHGRPAPGAPRQTPKRTRAPLVEPGQ